MPDLSPAQKKYLACVRREKYLIHVSRIFLFLGFLLLWEVSARQDGSILLSSAVRLRSGEHFLRWYRISLCLHISESR